MAPKTKFSETLEAQHKEEIERQPMTMTRKAIARNMEESWKIPRAVHMDIINATTLWNMVSVEKPKVLRLLRFGWCGCLRLSRSWLCFLRS